MKALVICLFALFLTLTSQAQSEAPNYRVASWFMPPLTREVYAVHDFNDSGIVAGTWIRYTDDSLTAEETRGIFVWRNGVLRKITPAQGGITSTLSPAEGTQTGMVRISNVRGDDTFLLAAPARQTVPANAFEVEHSIHRVVKFTIEADLETYPQPVVSAVTLGGFIVVDYNTQPGWNREFSGGVTDITDEGAVLGYTSDWPFSYPPQLYWAPGVTGFSERYFDLGDYGIIPRALDRDGRLIGSHGNLNPPAKDYLFDAPLSSISPTSVTMTRFPTLGGFIDQVEGNPDQFNYSYNYAAHGPYRAMAARDGVPSTAVWSDSFATVNIASQFILGYSTSYATPSRCSLSRNGHMIGGTSNFWHAAVAKRNLDGSYTTKPIYEMEAPSLRLQPPFSDSTPGTSYLMTPLAINSNLELLCDYPDQRGRGFFVLSDQPGPGEIVPVMEASYGSEDPGLGASVFFDRRFGKSGPASLRVTLASGGVARAGFDYVEGETAVLEWAAGEAGVKAVQLPLIDDVYEESEETLKVVVSEMTGATYSGNTEFLVTIYANDFGNDPEPDGAGPDPGETARILAQISALRQEAASFSKKLKAAKKIKNPKARARKIKVIKAQILLKLTQAGLLGNSL